MVYSLKRIHQFSGNSRKINRNIWQINERRERERQRDRERERQRDRDRQTETERQKETETETAHDSSRGCHFAVIMYGL